VPTLVSATQIGTSALLDPVSSTWHGGLQGPGLIRQFAAPYTPLRVLFAGHQIMSGLFRTRDGEFEWGPFGRIGKAGP
jgi:hypothetical protein